MSITSFLPCTSFAGVRSTLTQSCSFHDLSVDNVSSLVASLSRRLHHPSLPVTITSSQVLSIPTKVDEVPSNFSVDSDQEDVIVRQIGFSGCPAAIPEDRTQSSELFEATLSRVYDGLSADHVPQLTPDGSGGTYMMFDASGRTRVAVFKPMDEEPLAWNCPRGMPPSETGEGLKRGTRVGQGAYREVAAYLLDHPLNEGDEEGFAGVPRTALVQFEERFFPTAMGSPVTPLEAGKVGSLQEFVPAMSNCEDMGPSRFPVGEVHKIAVLDMRLANTDRNGANILVQQVPSSASDSNDSSSASFRLVPIDHGYCLPESWEDCTLEWLYWPQAKKPFADDARSYIARLDADADVATLQEAGWTLPPSTELVFKASTMLLKKGAGAGRTPFEIGSLMVRDDPDEPSEIEKMVEAATSKLTEEEAASNTAVANLMVHLEPVMDAYFQ
eukprot:TRINITY_DN10529_c0_g1_i1.p1 TRINITY_DN10529_c0_g1~~TRINITY_DN10529_c0_g1_i1.p1  ORF type:complete len:443 (-),score=1.68 TRINITY_DN10529_c0_g1_i1:402-1730(-)